MTNTMLICYATHYLKIEEKGQRCWRRSADPDNLWSSHACSGEAYLSRFHPIERKMIKLVAGMHQAELKKLAAQGHPINSFAKTGRKVRKWI